MSEVPVSGTAHRWIEAGTLATLLIPMVYTAGWSYAFKYFQHFHLGLLGLEIPREHFFLYGFFVVRDRFFSMMMILLLMVVLYLLSRHYFFKKPRTRPKGALTTWLFLVHVALVPALTLFAFVVFYFFGEVAAQSAYEYQVKAEFPAYPRVQVWISAEAAGAADPAAPPRTDPMAPTVTEAMAEDWAGGCYRLLLRSKDHLYVFYPARWGDKVPTDIIPTANVRSVRVTPHYHNCKG